MPLTATRRYSQNWLKPAFSHEAARTLSVTLAAGFYPFGTAIGLFTATTPTNQAWTLTASGTVSGGTFTLAFANFGSYAGPTTPPIPYNVTAANLQPILDATFGAGNLVAAGGALPGSPITLTAAADFGNKALPNLILNPSLTGTTPAITPTISTAGVSGPGGGRAYAHGNADGTQKPMYLLKYDVTVTPDGTHLFVTPEYGDYQTVYCPVYFSGYFRSSEVPNFDTTNMLADNPSWTMIAGSVGTATASTSRVKIG